MDEGSVPRQRPPRFREMRERYANSYKGWSEEDDAALQRGVVEGCSVEEIAKNLCRRPSAVRSRIRVLGI